MKKGFTLIEILVGTAIFIVVAFAVYQAYISLFKITGASQYKIIALNLANEQFEIVRNMPYTDVGIVNGLPNGKIPYQQTLTRSGVTFLVTATVRNIDIAYDGVVSASTTDTSPADNKLVEFSITCPTCNDFTPVVLTTSVAPRSLETSSINGALSLKVFDANGIPIQDADITITNSKVTPTLTIHDVSNVNGVLQVIGAPTGTNAYAVSVTKTGYSTDRTYPTGAAGNPTPTKPDATVLAQQVTPISFSIDRLSNLAFSSVTNTCSAVPSVAFTLAGSKTIGPGVLKYYTNQTTNSSGLRSLSNMEWDTYTVTATDTTYDLIGLTPLNPIVLNPNSTQSVQLIVAPKNPKSLLVTVKDSATLLPLTDATVVITSTTTSYTDTKITDQGYLLQTDWSGGAGQSTTTDLTKYFSNDGNISVNSPAGDATLRLSFGSYAPSGVLESSTFDTGSVSNFHNIYWTPSDQPIPTGVSSVKFQIATATSSSPTSWNYLGPDGTASTYYTSAGAPINSVHSGDQFLRYKMYLSTDSATSTPNVSDVSFTFTSSCTPPGQVMFSGLATGNYILAVGKNGYATSTATVNITGSWKEQPVILAP